MHVEYLGEIGDLHLGERLVAQDAGIGAEQVDLAPFLRGLATIAVTCSKFRDIGASAIASPPALRISSTTASAGVSEPPVPSRAPPKSLTTTFAPRLANPSACARPRPLPAPVTMATRPST